MDLGLPRGELGQDPAQAQRVLAERGSHPVVAGGRRVALVEDQVDDLEHRRQARGELGPARDLEGDMRLGEGPLGADDALGDRRLRDEEGTRDLLGGQAAEQAERERDPRLGGQHRMAGGEDEAQEVVADVVVEGRVEIRHRHFLRPRARGRAPRACARSSVFRRKRSMARCFAVAMSQAPGLSGHARLRPLLERGDQGVLGQLLGQADIAHDPRETGDEPGRLDPPDRVDRAMGIGSRHGYRSHHLQSGSASRGYQFTPFRKKGERMGRRLSVF